MAKFLSSAEALAHINKRLSQTISKSQFRTIYNLMVEAGDATPAVERQSGWVLTENLWQWSVYLATRQNLIEAGVWSSKRPYSIEDMESIAVGGLYEDSQPD